MPFPISFTSVILSFSPDTESASLSMASFPEASCASVKVSSFFQVLHTLLVACFQIGHHFLYLLHERVILSLSHAAILYLTIRVFLGFIL